MTQYSLPLCPLSQSPPPQSLPHSQTTPKNTTKKDSSVDNGEILARHLLHDNEFEVAPPPMSPQRHSKDNFESPSHPPATEFDMAYDPPSVEASIDTFATHLLHDQQYDTRQNKDSSQNQAMAGNTKRVLPSI